MARVRTSNEIILTLLDYFRVAQPNMDTKPGTVARDLAIDSLANQIAKIYDELNRVSSLQSLRTALGIDLDRLGSNFDVPRIRGAKATGIAVLAFNSLDTNIAVNRGDIITGNNGATFQVVNGVTISSVNASQYKANAARLRGDLDFDGISDIYAVEVLVQATTSGVQGNISRFSLRSVNTPGINNVTNTVAFGGGRAAESDAAYKARIISVFSGANTGTSLGYREAVLADPSVIDAIVIEPGDSLMTRDGTQVFVAEDGTRTIISEGSGGKVDILVSGLRLQEVLDSYIYRDLSNTNDPTNSANNFVLGQIDGDEDKTVTRKRLDNIASGILPNQPVNNIVSVSGSISGNNFVEKSVDELGRITGNYELLRDTGIYAGSPWGFDALHWISDRISGFSEDKTKSTFNGQDSLAFPDLLEISAITQNIQVNNENSRVVSTDRSYLQLAHAPITNVSRVFNVTTGERYVVVNQNPDSTGTINPTGRIQISGRSLPAVSDTLQVDYIWNFSYDPWLDFDNRLTNFNPRIVQDSVDWGFSNTVNRERSTLIASGSVLTVTTTHPISSVVSVNTFQQEDSSVTLTSGRISVILTQEVTDVVSIVRDSDGSELWNTSKRDGTFSGLVAFLPTDTVAVFGDSVSVVYNTIDVFNADTEGKFSDNTITISPSSDAVAGTLVETTYIANISVLLPATLLPTLPAIRSGNSFDTNTSTGIGTQPTTHIFDTNSQIVSNLRKAPSNLGLNITGSISSGIITVTGTTMTQVAQAVFTVSKAGLTQNLSTPLKSALGLSSKESLSSNVRIAKIARVEKVTATSGFEVLSSDVEFDVKGYALFDNSFVKEESIVDSTLGVSEFKLPSTANNLANLPAIGERLRVTFYYTKNSDSENVSFSRSGLLYTNKKFAIVDTIAISSGFTSGGSAAATLTVTNINQPITRSRYQAVYDYLGPKSNERITINFNYDRLITDATLAVENTRPITADVLVKAATPLLVDATLNIVVTDEFVNSSSVVIQNVQDAITQLISTSGRSLGSVLDASDLIDAAYNINGVDRVRVLFFNEANSAGSVLSIQSLRNQYLVPNDVIINLESR